METLIIIMHLAMALVIIALIMLQQGKGASMGVTFGGGASQTILGAAGRAPLLAKITAVLMALFFVSSFMLTIWSRSELHIDPDLLEGLPGAQQTAPEQDAPEPELPQTPEDEPPPELPQVPEDEPPPQSPQ